MRKKIYIIQPTYRRMDGSKVKGWSLFNHSLFLPIFNAVIPADWERESCLEYYQDINYFTDASVILISCMGYDIVYAKEIAMKFKQLGKKVIFGAHWDEFSEKILCSVCDSVFFGYPGYDDMKKLLEDSLGDSLKPSYKFDINLNFPFDYSVLNGLKFPVMQVQASIGCKHNCSYCCAAQVYNSRYRLRKIDYVISDLKAVCKISKYASFMDQNIFNNPEYTKRLCRRIIAEGIKIRWGAQCTANIGDDYELLCLLKKAGCRVLFLGLETIEQRNMQQLNKRFLTQDYQEQITKIRDAGLLVVGYFMLGMDWDTESSFSELYKFVKESKMVLPIINILIPVPGTRIFTRFKDENRLLIRNEKEFLDDNPLYSVPTNRVFYIPQSISAEGLRDGIARLGRQLFTLRNILLRSKISSPSDAIKVFVLNMELRKKYYAM